MNSEHRSPRRLSSGQHARLKEIGEGDKREMRRIADRMIDHYPKARRQLRRYYKRQFRLVDEDVKTLARRPRRTKRLTARVEREKRQARTLGRLLRRAEPRFSVGRWRDGVVAIVDTRTQAVVRAGVSRQAIGPRKLPAFTISILDWHRTIQKDIASKALDLPDSFIE